MAKNNTNPPTIPKSKVQNGLAVRKPPVVKQPVEKKEEK